MDKRLPEEAVKNSIRGQREKPGREGGTGAAGLWRLGSGVCTNCFPDAGTPPIL